MQPSPTDVGASSAPVNANFAFKAVRLALLSCILAAILGAFLISISSLCDEIGFYLMRGDPAIFQLAWERPSARSGYIPEYYWNDVAIRLTGADRGKAEHLTLTLRVDARSIDCRYTLSGPSDVLTDIERQMLRDPGGAVEQLLGSVEVNGQRLSFKHLDFDPSSGTTSTIVIESTTASIPDFLELTFRPPPKTQHLVFASKDVVLEATNWHSEDTDNLIRSGEPDHYRIQDAKAESVLRLRSVSSEDTEQPLASLIQQSGLMSIPLAGDLAQAFLWSIPYLLLWVVAKRAVPATQEMLRNAVVLVLLLELGVALISSLRFDLGALAADWSWLESLLTRVCAVTTPVPLTYGRASTFVVLLFAGLLWPGLVHRYLRPQKSPAILSLRRHPLVILVVFLLTAGAITAWIQASATANRFAGIGMLLGISALVLFWILWELLPFWLAIWNTFLGVFAIATLAVCTGIPNFVSAPPYYHNLLKGIAVSITVLLGMRIVVALLRLSAPLLGSAWFDRMLARRWLLYGAAIALCFPTTWIHDPNHIWWGEIDPLVFVLRNIFIFVVIAALLRFLKELDAQNRWPALSETSIDCGIALGITAFYSSTSIWFYFPIPLIVGFVMLRWFLFAAPAHASVAEKLAADWKDLFKSALNLQHAEQLASDVKKGLKDKVAKGEIAWLDYQQKLSPFQNDVESQREALTRDGCQVEKFLFSYSPTKSSWKSGINAALYSAVFALPWILFSIRDLLNQTGWESYLLLYFLGSAAMIAARWTLYGFFFGYFYAWLRGHNGLEKALCLWIAVVTPSVLAAVLSSPLDSASFAPLLFWTLQVFLHCMLLGFVVGELQPLWAADLSWRQMLDFHKFSGLSAWGSSFLLALGAAITTAVSSNLGSLITHGLKYVGVLPAK